MSLFITFEGIEGSGKTTQIRLLAEHLLAGGRDILLTREPGGCPIADAIRRILLDPQNAALVPRAELLLYAAARAQHVEEVIVPALRDGKTVLCDRFTDATLAYQGGGRGLDRNLIDRLNALAAGPLVPDLTILLDMPAEEGLHRARRRNAEPPFHDEDRFEREALAFHRRVRDGYLAIASTENRVRVVNALGSKEEVARRIIETTIGFIDGLKA